MRRLISAFVAGVLFPAAAAAQQPAASFSTLGLLVKPGDRVQIVDRQAPQLTSRNSESHA